ncbi:MAG: hypothetical protein AAFZ18_39615 [Myxococcota bacterium]
MPRKTALAGLCLPLTLACGDDGSAAMDGEPSSAESGSTPAPTLTEVCQASLDCASASSPLTLADCLASSEPEYGNSVSSGCQAEADASNRCTVEALSMSCELSALGARCASAYQTLVACETAAGELTTYGCNAMGRASNTCIFHEGNVNDASGVCQATGPVVAACPEATTVGRCLIDNFGFTRVTTVYYAPQVSSFDQLQEACRAAGGTFSQ